MSNLFPVKRGLREALRAAHNSIKRVAPTESPIALKTVCGANPQDECSNRR
jgi:hypothetical protein